VKPSFDHGFTSPATSSMEACRLLVSIISNEAPEAGMGMPDEPDVIGDPFGPSVEE